MTTLKSKIESAEVREVQDAFERWRSGKKHGREAIPRKLWRMAAALCISQSVNRVARCLGLNHTALKAEVDRRSAGSRRPDVLERHRKPTFVELNRGTLPAGIIPESSSARATTALAPTQAPGVEYIVEAPDPRQGTPRIHVRGATVLEVATLVRALHAEVGQGAA
jgi:hypothetical protein